MPSPPDLDVLRRRLRRVRSSTSDPFTVVDNHWLAALTVAAVAVQVHAGSRIHGAVPPGKKLTLRDSVIFEYIGWRLSRGGRLYVDVWEIKPPLSFEVTALLAALSGGNIGLYHDLVLVFTGAAAVGCAVLVGALVRETTGDGVAALAGGLSVYAMPAFYWRATVGFKAKYFVVAAGLLAVYLHLRERDLWSGVAAGAAVGFWQFGVIFPAVVGGLLAQRRAGDRARRFLAGLVGTGVLVVLPVAFWGALDEMLVETVIAPLLVTENATAADRFQLAVRLLGVTLPIAVLGAVGLGWSLSDRYYREQWWAPALGGWFAAQVLLFDLDAEPDLFPWFVVASLGVGLLLGRDGPDVDVSPGRAVAVALVLFVGLGAVTLGGFGTGRTPYTSPSTYDAPQNLEPELPYNGTEQQYVFWNERPPESCRLFAGYTQFQLVKTMDLAGEGVRYWETSCGQLGPALDALAEKYG